MNGNDIKKHLSELGISFVNSYFDDLSQKDVRRVWTSIAKQFGLSASFTSGTSLKRQAEELRSILQLQEGQSIRLVDYKYPAEEGGGYVVVGTGEGKQFVSLAEGDFYAGEFRGYPSINSGNANQAKNEAFVNLLDVAKKRGDHLKIESGGELGFWWFCQNGAAPFKGEKHSVKAQIRANLEKCGLTPDEVDRYMGMSLKDLAASKNQVLVEGESYDVGIVACKEVSCWINADRLIVPSSVGDLPSVSQTVQQKVNLGELGGNQFKFAAKGLGRSLTLESLARTFGVSPDKAAEELRTYCAKVTKEFQKLEEGVIVTSADLSTTNDGNLYIAFDCGKDRTFEVEVNGATVPPKMVVHALEGEEAFVEQAGVNLVNYTNERNQGVTDPAQLLAIDSRYAGLVVTPEGKNDRTLLTLLRGLVQKDRIVDCPINPVKGKPISLAAATEKSEKGQWRHRAFKIIPSQEGQSQGGPQVQSR